MMMQLALLFGLFRTQQMTHFDLCDLPPCCSNGTNILYFLKAIVLSLGSQVVLFLTFFFFVLHWLQWKCYNGITKSV